ncbi:MAG: histidine kinase [Treponema sp.]|nr:histidine kinase [Treponema sp.]
MKKEIDGNITRLLIGLGIYRIVALVVIFVFTYVTEGRWTQQGRIFIVLCLSTALYLVFCFHKKYFILLLALDYFAALLYAYYEPHFVFVEFIWLPQLLTSVTLLLPWRLSLPLVPVMCLGGTFFSYGFIRNFTVSIEGLTFPYFSLALLFYIPAAFLSLFASRSWFSMMNDRKSLYALQTANSHLNELTRSISKRMFTLQHDMTEMERNRLSKEIHDIAGYVFINIIMMLQAAAAVFHKDTKKAETLIVDARNYAERGINEIRHVLRNIREYSPVSLSLQNEFFNIGDVFQKATGTSVAIHYGTWPRSFSPIVDSFFTSFMQEALTNAIKHGHATEIVIDCQETDGLISMIIADNGLGAKLPIQKGIGISSLEDFAFQYGGGVDIQSGKYGFKIKVSVRHAEEE